MNNKYDFIDQNWDGDTKTVWSYKKQEKFVKHIISKYPKPIDLRKKLLESDNKEARKIGRYINPNWSNENYIKFIESNIIKYSNIGKIILAQTIGTIVGVGTWYGANQYFGGKLEDFNNRYKNGLSHSAKDTYYRSGAVANDMEKVNEFMYSNPTPGSDVNEPNVDDYGSMTAEQDIIDAQYPKHYETINKWSPILSSLGAKSLATMGTYSFLNKIDKKTN